MTFDYRQQYQEYRKYIERLKQTVKTPAAQVSLTVVGSLLFSAFLSAAALRPTLVIIASLVRDIRVERQTIDALDKKIRSLQVASSKLELTDSLMGPANIAIPEQLDVDVFSKEIEILAIEHGLALLEVGQRDFILYDQLQTTADPIQQATIQAVPVSLTVGGSEESIRQFVDDLEQLDRLVVIQSAQLTSVPPGSRQDRPFPVSARVSMVVYTSQQVLEQKRPVQDASQGDSL